MVLVLLPCLLGKGNGQALLRLSALEPHQEAVDDGKSNAYSPATMDHALGSKSITPLEKMTRRLRRDTSHAAATGSGSCRKLYQVVSRATLQAILHTELQGRRIVSPIFVSLPYCAGSCNKVTYSNYHQLIRDAHHGSNGNHGTESVCQAEGDGKLVLIVVRNGTPTFTYQMLEMPLEITKCSCYPGY